MVSGMSELNLSRRMAAVCLRYLFSRGLLVECFVVLESTNEDGREGKAGMVSRDSYFVLLL
jgi:hypothetical protein